MPKRKRRPPPPPPEPTPPPATNRSFTDASWWNTPIPSSVPVDPNSGSMTAKQAASCPPPKVQTSSGAWSMPWSEVVTGGLLMTIQAANQGGTVKVYIDPHIGSMTGDDAAMVFRDWRTGIEVNAFEAVVPRKADGTVDGSKPITCKNLGNYKLTGNGIDSQAAGGDPDSGGHRGIPPSAMALTPWEASSALQSRKKISLGPPGDSRPDGKPMPIWPMVGNESPRGGAIPEGAVIRRKAPGSNPVQVAAHVYGFIVGDTAGSGKSSLKTVKDGSFSSTIMNSFDGDTWADWEVMTLGWGNA